jgi:hypothetical protein
MTDYKVDEKNLEESGSGVNGILTRHMIGRPQKYNKKSVRIAGVSAKIRTENFPHIRSMLFINFTCGIFINDILAKQR